eukprot:TRINITY_DN9843_c0_g1_i1.p1 TRINITY_DN9843_c0_g1~~TRINITY_DN9843_c0_g1_i1.p1  ORF type:complete len:153 (-),score=21.44 TRINITY_DN9843_c0_g1_i1:167-625(-)
MDSRYQPVGPSGIPLVRDTSPCDFEAMKTAKNALIQQRERLASSVNTSETWSELYLSSVLWFHPAIQNCLHSVISSSVTEYENVTTITNLCLNPNSSDVCCDPVLRNHYCCVPRPQKEKVLVLSTPVNHTCGDSDCYNNLLLELGQSLLESR